MSICATAHAAGTVTIYSDTECKNKIQQIQFSDEDVYQCKEFQTGKSVVFSTTGFDNLGFNVWVGA